MSLTEAQINTIYKDVVQRSATGVEQTTWFNQDAPQGPLSDGSVVTSIVQLPEVTNYVDPVIGLYQAVFDRVPDQAGFKVNVQAVDPADGGSGPVGSPVFGAASLTAAYIADGGTSGEFFKLYGIDDPNEIMNAANPASAAFITSLYQNILNRTPGPAPGGTEIGNWEALNQSASQLVYGVFFSSEFTSEAAAPEQELLTDDALGVKVPGFA